jgi:hypothetical protein
MKKGNRMLTTKETAERLEISEASIRVWLNNEKEKAERFPNAVKFGRDWQIPESDLEGFVKRGRGRPPKPSSQTSQPTKSKRAAEKARR